MCFLPKVLLAQMPEVKPLFLPDTTPKKGQQIKTDSVYPVPSESSTIANKVMILERPGHKRIVFAVGSPIIFYTNKDQLKHEAIVTRVESKAFFITMTSGTEAMILYDDVHKLIIGRQGRFVSTGKLIGTALMVAGLGYMGLYAINPGEGNNLNLSESAHARTSVIVSSGLFATGLMLRLMARDQRIRPGSGWKWRIDDDNPYYWPQIQK